MSLILNGTDGSVSTPAVQGGTGGATTGVYYPASNQVALATNGAQRLLVDSNGLVGVGTSSPNGSLTIGTQINALTGTTNTYGLHLYPSPSGTCYVDALTNSSSNTSIALRSYNNGTYNALTLNLNGNLALPGGVSTSGVGVTFPATQSASSDANCLDDYEEGTWTPVCTAQSGSITSYVSSGFYTKIGRSVTIYGRVQITNIGTASGQLLMSGVPFSTYNGAQYMGTVRETVATGNIYWVEYISTSAYIQNSTNGGIAWATNYTYEFNNTYQAQ